MSENYKKKLAAPASNYYVTVKSGAILYSTVYAKILDTVTSGPTSTDRILLKGKTISNYNVCTSRIRIRTALVGVGSRSETSKIYIFLTFCCVYKYFEYLEIL
jgi:hypothetical protein